jgi:hypothetical protein
MRRRLRKKKGLLKENRIKRLASDHAHKEAVEKRFVMFWAEAEISKDEEWPLTVTIADTERTPVLRWYEAQRRKYGERRTRFESEVSHGTID